jgi:nitrite reductase/ring-hydroxylating ferredoxin subunit
MEEAIGRTFQMTLHGLSLDLTGWFQIGWSSDVAIGDVASKHYFGTDLVVYRGRDGQLRVHDRYCRHLGASLAHGGCVVDEGIRCPFHGWVWGPDGQNVSIPYQERPNRARLGTWRVTELNEAIYVWHDPEGTVPQWALSDALTLAGHASRADFSAAGEKGRSHFTDLRVHPQMVLENVVDPHHFHFVHRTPKSPLVLAEKIEGPRWWSRVGFGRRWTELVNAGRAAQESDTANTIEILWDGVGVSVNTEHTRDGIRVIAINTTPVDDGCTEMLATYWIDRRTGDVEDGSYQRRLDDAKVALPDDLNVWNHQVYLDKPALATEEASGFARLRQWSQQFYPRTG